MRGNSHNVETLNTPATISDLRAVLAQEQTLRKSSIHGKRAIGVLAGLLDRPGDAAMYSITQLAGMQGVHASTLTRLAKNLGYSGFGDFQAVFRNHLSGNGHFYSRQVDNLLNADGRLPDTDQALPLAVRVTDTEIDNIRHMRQDLDTRQLAQAAELLAIAPRIRTHGLRQSYAIACYLSYALGLLRSDVSVLGFAEHGIAHSLAQLETGDALLVIGCTPYTRSTVQTAEMAAKHDMPVVALTDSHASPLTAFADYSFIAPATGAFVSNNMGATFVLAEVLVSMVAQILGGGAIAALERREEFIHEQKIEL